VQSIEGNIRKMTGSLEDEVHYTLPLFDVLEPSEQIDMNELIGKPIQIQYQGYINSILSGEKMKKAYGEGLTYKEFMKSPLAVESIIRPELSRIHEGIALRDEEWERKHHLQPHVVYLSYTSAIKVGVTRSTQIPTRWIDQGATQAILLAETPYRQAAGLIEVALKAYVADKTHWQKMLKNQPDVGVDLRKEKERLIAFIPDELKPYILEDNTMMHLNYPIRCELNKITSQKLDKVPEIVGNLCGIKGQYLMFEEGHVMNIRSHTGYRIKLSF
jgi:hypothetical protein